MPHPNALIIDFETANYSPNSACALGMVRIENSEIVRAQAILIRPPTREFTFTHIHGLDWNSVSSSPSFLEHWNLIRSFFDGVDVLVAHNIGFDNNVLRSTAHHYGITLPPYETACTVQMSRNVLGIKPANLANVSKQLGITLDHHNAGSDALACAQIFLYSLTGSVPGALPEVSY